MTSHGDYKTSESADYPETIPLVTLYSIATMVAIALIFVLGFLLGRISQ